MPSDLPSLNAVRVFDVAARHLNFSRAADELHVTQSAVSRQVRRLEDQLGQALFERAGPVVRLTGAGEMYRVKVAEALTLLRRGTAELRRAGASPALTVSVLPSFASKWLVPRIFEFEREHPGVDLRLAASYRLVEFATEPDVDAAIRLGRGGWPGVHASRLTALHVFPVCSPGMARRLRRPADILRQRLLTDDSIYDEWPRWFDAVGVDGAAAESRHFADDIMLLQAAIAGQGITLARAVIAQDEIDAGRLVRPFEASILSAFQYHFVCSPERLGEPHIQALHAWLLRALDGRDAHP
ncbi:MAG: transcriptional regulator GcvA [Gammaproteobacteria bacterium]